MNLKYKTIPETTSVRTANSYSKKKVQPPCLTQMHSVESLHISSTNLEEGSFREKKRKACHARYIIMRTAAKFQTKINSPRLLIYSFSSQG